MGLFAGKIFTCYGSSSSIVWLQYVDQLECWMWERLDEGAGVCRHNNKHHVPGLPTLFYFLF